MFTFPDKYKEVGLSHNPFKAIVSPRPIGWISTRSIDDYVNIAPYSFFNAVSEQPPMVMFSSAPNKDKLLGKDTLLNIKETGEFVVNIVSYAFRDKMNITSKNFPRGINEFEEAGIKMGQSKTVSVPYVKFAPASLECTLWKTLNLPENSNGSCSTMIIGIVTGINIENSVIRDGKIDVTLYQPIARLGYSDYSRVEELFSIKRPD